MFSSNIFTSVFKVDILIFCGYHFFLLATADFVKNIAFQKCYFIFILNKKYWQGEK